MISLKKLAADGLIKLTDARRKYTIDGVQRLEAIYRIPLKYLYYNNQNGRISTALQKYVSGHPEMVLNPALDDENPEYNDLFESFIFKSNEQRMKATQESISDRGQEEPGVVLDDGRVIDGNRRFTALRRIQKSKGIEQYFEAAILDFDITNSVDKKTIKQLELDLQMGKEDRQDYDPIDRIFDVYNTVYVEKIMTPQEYAKSIGKERARGINNDIKEAELISSYLEFIGAPRDAYYIAKELRLDGPMNEVRRVLDKNKLLDDGEVKSAVFALLSMHYSGTDANEGGDITRLIRKELQSMVSKKDDWVCLTEDNVDTIYDAFQDTPVSDASQISQIRQWSWAYSLISIAVRLSLVNSLAGFWWLLQSTPSNPGKANFKRPLVLRKSCESLMFRMEILTAIYVDDGRFRIWSLSIMNPSRNTMTSLSI